MAKKQAKILSAITVAAAVGGAGGAIVMASVPDGSGVIHSCYRNTALTKTFRVIDSATTACNANETALNWNQQGPQGNTGPTGPAGSQASIGHNLTLGWGDIPAEGTPQPLYTVPDFGDFTVTQCDSEGNVDYTFKNLSEQTISYIDANGDNATLVNNSVLTYSAQSNFFPTQMWIGNGQTSQVVFPVVNINSSQTNQTCNFYGKLL